MRVRTKPETLLERKISETEKWYKEMNKQGCKAVEAGKLGKIPYVEETLVSECPKVVIDGVVYRDTTELLYQDTRYSRNWLDEKGKKEMTRQEGKYLSRLKAEAEEDDEGRAKYGRYTKEQVNIIIKMREKGKTSADIGKELGKSEGSITGKVYRMRKKGLTVE